METKIFRFKLTDAIMESITYFAKIHQLDDRHMYKEAWNLWLVENQDTVQREVMRLQQLGYKGDVIDKMFKAGRYYFREKAVAQSAKVPESVAKVPEAKVQSAKVPEAKAPVAKPKRDYITMDHAIIQAMDTHLQGLIKNKDFKPANAYQQFSTQQGELLRTEIERLKAFYDDDKLHAKVVAKIKKTYKNRYFMLTN